MNYRLIWGLLCLFCFVGCEGARHLSKGEQLIERTPNFRGNDQIENEMLLSAVKTEPNKRILYTKPYLNFYNLGKSLREDSSVFKKVYQKLDKQQYYEKSVSDWLINVVGEEPKVVDLNQIAEDCKNIESLYFSQGYFHAKARYEVQPTLLDPQKANVVYHIEEGSKAVLNEVVWVTGDTIVHALMKRHDKASILQAGNTYKEDDFTQERNRINELMHNEGFFRFNARQIVFEVDTSIKKHEINPKWLLKEKNVDPFINVKIILPDTLHIYIVDSIAIRLRFFLEDPLNLEIDSKILTQQLRRQLNLPDRRFAEDNSHTFITRERYLNTVNPNAISRAILISEQKPYSLSDSRETQRSLQELGMFRNSIINFKPDDVNHTLGCEIDLNLAKRFNYRIGFETFQTEQVNPSSNLPGIGGNLQLGYRNVFKRGEQLRMSANANLNFYSPDDTTELLIYSQIGGNLRLDVPRFMGFDFVANTLVQKNLMKYVSPVTSFSINYNRQRPREFLRTNLTLRLRYTWFHSDKHVSPNDLQIKSELTPIDFTIVKSVLEPDFEQRILGEQTALSAFLLQDFRQRVTLFSSYYRTISDRYGFLRNRSTTLFRYGIEIGGNIPYILDVIGSQLNMGDNNIRDQSLTLGPFSYGYGQFGRVSLEAKWFKPISDGTEVVARALVGAARGWNYTLLTPFENRFFTGGANSIRGWQSNTLGPGTFQVASGSRVITIGGEYKFEANLELRQDLVSPFELALFVDMGNVWLSDRTDKAAEGSALIKENLQLGVAAGIGLRLDLTFFVLRLDIGQQVYAPDIQQWVVKRFPKDIGAPRMQFNLAIGYPF